MRARIGVLAIVALALVSQARSQSESGVQWQTNVDVARQLAASNNKLVLIHFWAPWCGPCRRMEREVFVEPSVAAAVSANYVPVKINADHFQKLAEQYNVTGLPTDVVTTADGQLVQKMDSFRPAAEYIADLNRIAAGVRRSGPAVYTQIPGSATGPANTAGVTAPSVSAPSDSRYADYYRQRGGTASPQDVSAAQPIPNPATTAPAYANRMAPPGGTATTPAAAVPTAPGAPMGQAAATAPGASTTPAPNAAAANPPVALDGYCPVQLYDKRQWVQGDPRWGVVHRGRTYLFSGPNEQKRFFDNPDQYAPVASGIDVVAAIDRRQVVFGSRAHGGFYGSRVYLFADEDSLTRFTADPDRYVAALNQAINHQSGNTVR